MMSGYHTKCLLIPSKADIERDAVAQAWEAQGGIVQRLDRFWETPELEGRTPVLYGNHIFCLVLAQKLNLDLFSPPDDFLFHLPPKWLKRAVSLSTIADVAGIQYPCFIKPIVPKMFPAKVYGSYDELLENCEQLQPNTPVIHSDIIEICAEARAFILDNNALTVSIYEGDADITEATRFINGFLVENGGQSTRTYVLDVGLLSSGEWVVIEANAVWGAGLNGCDAQMAVRCITEATAASRP